jgi:hypothetical protein
MVAAAVVGAGLGSALISSSSSKSAANTASNAQTSASNAAIAQQNAQFQALQQSLAPYVNAGTGALTGQQNLLGLNGNDAQASAISGIQNGAQYQALQTAGNNALLQNASATGGLRGGNTQGALAQFNQSLLAQQIQQQYSNLGGLTSIGQNAAAGVGNAGMNNASQVSNLLQQGGAAQAGNALATGQANSSLYNALGSSVGTYAGLGGFTSGLGATSGLSNYNTMAAAGQF